MHPTPRSPRRSLPPLRNGTSRAAPPPPRARGPRLPARAEQREMARDASDSAVTEALAAVAAQRDLERRTADASRTRGQQGSQGQSPSASNDTKPMSFEQAEKARALG